MSDSPRTDRYERMDSLGLLQVSSDFARTLERGLNAAKAEIESLREQLPRWRDMASAPKRASYAEPLVPVLLKTSDGQMFSGWFSQSFENRDDQRFWYYHSRHTVEWMILNQPVAWMPLPPA